MWYRILSGIVVMGHEYCSAVKAAIEREDMGNLASIVSGLMPAVEENKGLFGSKTINNIEYYHAVAETNVRYNVQKLRNESPILSDLESNGKLVIVGSIYDMNTGKVTFLEE